VRRAEILLALGTAVHKSGANAWPHYAAARELFDALPEETRARAPLQHLLGKILVDGAGAALRARQDPEPLLTLGTQALTRAAQQTPNVLGIWETLGSGWRQLANVAASRGGDARTATVEALTAFDRALALSPDNPALLSSRATVHHEAALRDTGDGEAHFTAALEDLDRAIAAQAGRYALHVNRALVLRDRAARRVQARNDAGLADYDDAVRSLGSAIAIDPAPWKAWFDRASIRVSVGKLVKASAKDPTKWYRAALADFDQALERAPRNLDVAHNRANARRLLAEHLGPEGRALLEQAEVEFRAVVERAPRAWQALAGWAMTLEGLDRPAEARTAWERVVAVKPDLALARERLAALGGQ